MTAPRIPRRSAYIPAGADQQGRLPRTGCFIQAGEAATDVGTEEPDFKREAFRSLLFWIAVALALIGFVAGTLYGVFDEFPGR